MTRTEKCWGEPVAMEEPGAKSQAQGAGGRGGGEEDPYGSSVQGGREGQACPTGGSAGITTPHQKKKM